MKERGKERLKQAIYESTRAPQKRKPTPPRYARQPLPREGARVDAPSFLWKGRRLDGDSGMKESEEMHLKSTIYESTLSTADAVPLPQGGRLRGATLHVDCYKGRCPKAEG